MSEDDHGRPARGGALRPGRGRAGRPAGTGCPARRRAGSSAASTARSPRLPRTGSSSCWSAAAADAAIAGVTDVDLRGPRRADRAGRRTARRGSSGVPLAEAEVRRAAGRGRLRARGRRFRRPGRLLGHAADLAARPDRAGRPGRGGRCGCDGYDAIPAVLPACARPARADRRRSALAAGRPGAGRGRLRRGRCPTRSSVAAALDALGLAPTTSAAGRCGWRTRCRTRSRCCARRCCRACSRRPRRNLGRGRADLALFETGLRLPRATAGAPCRRPARVSTAVRPTTSWRPLDAALPGPAAARGRGRWPAPREPPRAGGGRARRPTGPTPSRPRGSVAAGLDVRGARAGRRAGAVAPRPVRRGARASRRRRAGRRLRR